MKEKHKKDKMITILVTKPFNDRMKQTVEEDKTDELRNMSDLVRIGTLKEIKRRNNE